MRLVRVARAAASPRRRPAIRIRSSGGPPQATARKHFINTHASATPAAEAISDKGRPRRRSVKNRKSFDCFKSAEGIRFSQAQGRLRNRFTAAHFGSTFWVTKGGNIIKVFAVRRTAQFAAAPSRRTATRFQLVRVLRRRRTARQKNELPPRHSTFFFFQKEK